ncbi:Mth938-like domain-containing protein [Kiloniella antarctica]|uniref:Mth938-like domain-containing protein n=1 Tax=Kiloniella antarctica TaxID=1550907 RepID=A0ABW5BPI3_9PROT
MEVTLQLNEGQQVVEKYGNGRFLISNHYHEGSVLIRSEETVSWDVNSFDNLTVESLQPFIVMADQIEVLLIGCGSKTEFIPPKLREELRNKGLVIDAMDTGAACRTYNVLLSENRTVAAALIAVE